jgi:hypothetical protein
MLTLLQVFRLLTIVIWVGGIIFFAFVLAPVAFSQLPSQHIAGTVVGGTLRVLNIVGLACGIIFWTASFALWRRNAPLLKRSYEVQLLLSSAMILATAYLHSGILPAMEADRRAVGGDIEIADVSNPAKIHFEHLHKWSERVEGAVLLLGLGIVVLMSVETRQTALALQARRY